MKSHEVALNNEISPKLTQNITKNYNKTKHNIARSAQTPHEIASKYPKISQKHSKQMKYTKSKSHKSSKRCTKHKISEQNISKSYQVLRNLLKAHNVSQYQPTFYELSTKLFQITQNHFLSQSIQQNHTNKCSLQNQRKSNRSHVIITQHHARSQQNRTKSHMSTLNYTKTIKIEQPHTFAPLFTESQQNCGRLHDIIK